MCSCQSYTLPVALPSVKGKFSALGLDELKMVKQKSWTTTFIWPKLVGSMDPKGQIIITFMVSSTAYQAGKVSQSDHVQNIL